MSPGNINIGEPGRNLSVSRTLKRANAWPDFIHSTFVLSCKSEIQWQSGGGVEAVTIYFVTNICPHYRVKAFELLARLHRTRFLFFSEGSAAKYWERNNPTSTGAFDGGYVKSWKLFSNRLRFVPGLYLQLLFGNYDVLIKCINGKMPLLLSFLIAGIRGIPFVLWTGLWSHPQTLVHRFTFPVTRWIYRKADAIAVCGPHVREYLTGLGVSGDKIFVAWQAVDNETLSAPIPESELQRVRNELDINNRKVILYVGRIERQKGLEYVVESLRIVSEHVPVTFIAVGTGSYSDEMQDRLKGRGFHDFRFPGYVPNHKLPLFYRLADVLVLASITTRDFREPWGLVINEAMNQGCPVVATNAVGAVVGGLVKNGKTGLIVPERNSEALAQALEKILQDQERQKEMRAAVLEEIRQWTYERMVKGFSDAVEYASAQRQ